MKRQNRFLFNGIWMVHFLVTAVTYKDISVLLKLQYYTTWSMFANISAHQSDITLLHILCPTANKTLFFQQFQHQFLCQVCLMCNSETVCTKHSMENVMATWLKHIGTSDSLYYNTVESEYNELNGSEKTDSL